MLYQYVHCTSINKNIKESGLGLVADILHTPVQQSQPFWHLGPVSWKTIFPWGLVGQFWFGMIQKRITFIVYFIPVIITSIPP